MKVLVLCFALIAIISAAPQDDTVLRVGNSIDNLIREALEYIRKQLKTHEPLKVNGIPEQVIKDDDTKVYLTIDLDDVEVSKASDFTVDHIENNLVALWAKFGLTIPAMHVEGKYTAKGNVQGHDVQGQGTFTVDLSSLTVSGFIQMEVLNHAMHASDLKLNYTLSDLKFKETGLSVSGISDQELEDIFNKQMLKFLQDQEPLVCEKIARQVLIEGNDIMKGKTLEELIQWLKDFIGH